MAEAAGQDAWRNLLEPAALPDLFASHPPRGFAVGRTAQGLPYFHTPYNLLTTLEREALARVRSLPLYERWSKLLTWRTCFCGTTCTEYAPLPAASRADELVRGLLDSAGPASLLVIKDVPDASPLLPRADNDFAALLRKEARALGFMDMEGQALAYVPMDFSSTGEYLARLSAGRRKDLRRKMKSLALLTVEEAPLGDARFSDPAVLDRVYALYLAVHGQSEIHFDLLSRGFFAALLQSSLPGVVMCYLRKGELVGWNICLEHQGRLVDKYIGLSYPLARELNLYFVSWMLNLEYALKKGHEVYIAGWTDPEVKAGLGARFTFTRHLARMGNPVLRKAMLPLRRFFEGDARALEKL